jgi:hypothetical protein
MVAVVAVRVVEMTLDKVVHMVAVRNRVVSTSSAVLVIRTVCAAVVIGSALARIPFAHRQPVIVDVALVRMM